MLLETQVQKIFDDELGLSIDYLGLNNWSHDPKRDGPDADIIWGYFEIQKGQSPINFYSTALDNEKKPMLTRVTTRRFKSLHGENIEWLAENGYVALEDSLMMRILSWIFDKRGCMDFRKEERYGQDNMPGRKLEILLYIDRHQNPEAWGAMYLPEKAGTITAPGSIGTDGRDLIIQAYLREQSRELCKQLGENFNIFTYLELTNEGVLYKSLVRFGLPLMHLTAQEADLNLHKIANSSRRAFNAYSNK